MASPSAVIAGTHIVRAFRIRLTTWEWLSARASYIAGRDGGKPNASAIIDSLVRAAGHVIPAEDMEEIGKS